MSSHTQQKGSRNRLPAMETNKQAASSTAPPPLRGLGQPTLNEASKEASSIHSHSLSQSAKSPANINPSSSRMTGRTVAAAKAGSSSQFEPYSLPPNPSQGQFISYNSFLRRSLGSRRREDADRGRNRRDSEGLSSYLRDDESMVLGDVATSDEESDSYLPTLMSKGTATDFSGLFTNRSGATSALFLPTSTSVGSFGGAPGRSYSAMASPGSKGTFITETAQHQSSGKLTQASRVKFAPLTLRKVAGGISSLAAQQNQLDTELIPHLLDDGDTFENGSHRQPDHDVQERDSKTVFKDLQDCMDGLSVALKHSEQVMSDQRLFLSGLESREADTTNHQKVATQDGNAKKDPLALRRGLPRKGRLGPIHTINFGIDAEVEDAFRSLLAAEGVDSDTYLGSPGPNALAPKPNEKGLGQLLELLSKHTLNEEQQRVSEYINERYVREEDERRQRAVEARKVASAKKKLIGPAAPSNTYALLNEIHRRENNPNAKPHVSLVERFRASQDLTTKDGQLHGDGHTLHNGLTIKMILMRKIELLRRDKPLRLKFFEHADTLQKQIRKEQGMLGPAVALDGSLDNSSIGHNITARNVNAVCGATAESIARERQMRAATRDDRMEAARQRYNVNQDRRRTRFVALVERARGIGYEYDTGLTNPEDQFAYGSAANDLAAWWMQLIMLSKSRLALTDRMSTIMGTRKVGEAMARTKAKEVKSALTVQRWWKKTQNMRRAALRVSSILVVVKYLRALPKIQCRFRIAMHSLIHKVIRLQRHFRATFMYKRLRYEHAQKTVRMVIKQEIDRSDKDVAILTKERKKTEMQLNAAIKSRKQHFTDLMKQGSDRILERSKQKEYLLAITDATAAELATLVLGPKERKYRTKVAEYAQKARLKYLAATNAAKLIETEWGYLPPEGLYSFKEQDLIRRTYSMYIGRPWDALVVSSAEALGVIEERGYDMGAQDFSNTLTKVKSPKAAIGSVHNLANLSRSDNSASSLLGRPPSGSMNKSFK